MNSATSNYPKDKKAKKVPMGPSNRGTVSKTKNPKRQSAKNSAIRNGSTQARTGKSVDRYRTLSIAYEDRTTGKWFYGKLTWQRFFDDAGKNDGDFSAA